MNQNTMSKLKQILEQLKKDIEDGCYFGNVEASDIASLLKELEEQTEVDQDQSGIRNIILLGRTGSGKSTLANVLTKTTEFKESSGSTSETKIIESRIVEVDLTRDEKEKIKYRIIDTIGIGDTNLTQEGVFYELAKMTSLIKDGLNQILFVVNGRFTKEEIMTFELLKTIIFDKNICKFTTIVRTHFPDFDDEELCEEDREKLRDTQNQSNEDVAKLVNQVNSRIIYIDNPPLKGRSAITNEEIREDSRKKVLANLLNCREVYKPKNIDKVGERVRDHVVKEEGLKNEINDIKEQLKQSREREINAESRAYKREKEKQREFEDRIKDLENRQEMEKDRIARQMEEHVQGELMEVLNLYRENMNSAINHSTEAFEVIFGKGGFSKILGKPVGFAVGVAGNTALTPVVLAKSAIDIFRGIFSVRITKN